MSHVGLRERAGHPWHWIVGAGIVILLLSGVLIARHGGPQHVLSVVRLRVAEWRDPALLTPWPRRRVPPVPAGLLTRLATETWRRTVDTRAPAIYPSPSYGAIYLRDAFWVTGVLPDRSLALGMRQLFAQAQHPNGQVPSHFDAWQRAPVYDTDESTTLYVLWTCRDQQRFGTPPDGLSLQAALRYLRSTAPHGSVLSPPGVRRSWLDTFRLQSTDTLSYTQGLYAAALACAHAMGAPVSLAQAQAAQRAYVALYQAPLGYLPLGCHHPQTDVSSLVGDFVALWLLRRPLLSDHVVLSTLAHLAVSPTGYKVISQPNGTYLSPAAFSALFPAGEYQNGGAWLLYDEIALADGALHGWLPARRLMAQRVALDVASGRLFDEYSCTDPALPCFLASIPARKYTAWNTFVLEVNQVVARRSP